MVLIVVLMRQSVIFVQLVLLLGAAGQQFSLLMLIDVVIFSLCFSCTSRAARGISFSKIVKIVALYNYIIAIFIIQQLYVIDVCCFLVLQWNDGLFDKIINC